MSMRILMTTDTAGGVWIYSLDLCAALAGAGVSVRLVVLGTPSDLQRAAAERLQNVELAVRPTPLEWMPSPWEHLDALEAELLELADDCDLVHLDHLVHGHLDWGRPAICVVHSCVASWFEAVRGHPAPSEWDDYRRRVTRSLRAADHVVAPSAWMLRRACELYGPLRACSVIANGSAAPAAAPEAERRGVLAAGRVWDDAKNLAPLAVLATRLPEPLSIAGPREQPGVGAAEPEKGELSQPALWAQMRRSRVFVAPAIYEPFGLGVVEAARSGCALVLGDIPALRENWDGAALFVDPARPEQWKRAIEQLLADQGHRLALAHRAQARATTFTLETMANRYLALYRRILERQPLAACGAAR